ncbi:hypothetical protein FOZ63_015676, partial [Perkinsus olseni]
GRPSCLVATCAATNYVATVVVPDQTSKSFIHGATLLFNTNGYPSILAFDSDRTFLSVEARSFLSAMGIQALCLPGYAVRVAWWERSHQLIHSCVRATLLEEPHPVKVRQLEAAVSTATLASNETPRPQTTITPNQLMRVNGLRMQSIIRVVDSDIKQATREYIDTLLEPKQPTEAQVQVIHNTFARTLRQYMDMWSSPSLKRFGRSSKTVSTDGMCAIGDKVFFWRPRKSKLQSCWKEATVLDISRDKRTITIRRADGSISNEYYYNIAMLGGEAAAGVCQPTVGSRDD